MHVQAIFLYGYVQKHEDEICWENAYQKVQEKYPTPTAFQESTHLYYGTHGNSHTPYYYLAVAEGHYRANSDQFWPYYPKLMATTNTSEAHPDWDSRLEQFLEEYEIEIEDSRPQWWLVGYGE